MCVTACCGMHLPLCFPCAWRTCRRNLKTRNQIHGICVSMVFGCILVEIWYCLSANGQSMTSRSRRSFAWRRYINSCLTHTVGPHNILCHIAAAYCHIPSARTILPNVSLSFSFLPALAHYRHKASRESKATKRTDTCKCLIQGHGQCSTVWESPWDNSRRYCGHVGLGWFWRTDVDFSCYWEFGLPMLFLYSLLIWQNLLWWHPLLCWTMQRPYLSSWRLDRLSQCHTPVCSLWASAILLWQDLHAGN